MIEGFLPSDKGGGTSKVLAVILHGWFDSPSGMRDVIEAARNGLKKNDGGLDVHIYAPPLPYRNPFCVSNAVDVVALVLQGVHQVVSAHGPYAKIILIGYSLGAVIARRVFLVAAGDPPGFLCEEKFKEEKPREWVKQVDRIVTLAALNRGWQVSERMGWFYSILFNVFGLFGHIAPKQDWKPTIFDIRLGAPFIVQTRLHWLAYRRWHEKRPKKVIGDTDPKPRDILPDAPDPIVVQLIGTRDDLVSPYVQMDLAVDVAIGRYFFVELKDTNHEESRIFRPKRWRDPKGETGKHRRELFVRALTDTPDELRDLVKGPNVLADEVPKPDGTVDQVVFVMHGIRDDGFWTHRIATEVRECARNRMTFRSRTPTYGYFAILPFVLPWIRREKVEWFMDQYVSATAQFPNADINYLGHSNGTYIAARALKDYDAVRFRHVFFAGSVVRPDYGWKNLVKDERVQKLLNVRASADWVVALLPKSLEWWKQFDCGGAGFDGFKDADGSDPRIRQLEKYAKGPHSAAIVESQRPNIAKFIVDGTIPEPTPEKDFVDSPAFWLVPLSKLRIGIPALVLIFGIVIPICIAWPLAPMIWADAPAFIGSTLGHLVTISTSLLPQETAEAFMRTVTAPWARNLSVLEAVKHTVYLVAYFLLLKFIVTRV